MSESSSLCALMPSVLCVERGAPSNAVVLHNLTLAVSVSVSVDTDSGCEHVTFVQKHSLSLFFPLSAGEMFFASFSQSFVDSLQLQLREMQFSVTNSSKPIIFK